VKLYHRINQITNNCLINSISLQYGILLYIVNLKIITLTWFFYKWFGKTDWKQNRSKCKDYKYTLSFELEKRYILSDFSAQGLIQLIVSYRFGNSNIILTYMFVRQYQKPLLMKSKRKIKLRRKKKCALFWRP